MTLARGPGNLVNEPMDTAWSAALREAEMVLFETVELLFKQQPLFGPEHVRLRARALLRAACSSGPCSRHLLCRWTC